MNWAERRKRREQVVAEYRAGATVEALSKKYGLVESYLSRSVLWRPHEPRVNSAKPKTVELTPEQEKQNRDEAERLFSDWKKEHVRTCADLPDGECCDCHKWDDLSFIHRLGLIWYVCCGKQRANYKALGYADATLYHLPECGNK